MRGWRTAVNAPVAIVITVSPCMLIRARIIFCDMRLSPWYIANTPRVKTPAVCPAPTPAQHHMFLTGEKNAHQEAAQRDERVPPSEHAVRVAVTQKNAWQLSHQPTICAQRQWDTHRAR